MNLGPRAAASLLAAAALAMLALTSCAPDPGTSEPEGSRLAPEFRDRSGDGRASGDRSRQGQDRDADRAEEPRTRGQEGRAGRGRQPSTAPSSAPAAPSSTGGAAPGGAATQRASVTDARGDTTGVSAPAWIDLTAATLTRDAGRFRLEVDIAADLPRRQTDDRTANVVLFLDTDLDGRGDHEVWATLGDTGWSPSARHPDGAAFGKDSGAVVSVAGTSMVVSFPSRDVGDPQRLQWSVAAEHGTYEQVASGTTARDAAPEGGGALFPGP